MQVIPETYDEMKHMSKKTIAAGAGEADAAKTAAWTPDRVASEVQSVLKEVLGKSLEPNEPFMSGEGHTYDTVSAAHEGI